MNRSDNCFAKGHPDGTQIFRTVLKCSESYSYFAASQVSLKSQKKALVPLEYNFRFLSIKC